MLMVAIQITITVVAACGPGYMIWFGRKVMREYPN